MEQGQDRIEEKEEKSYADERSVARMLRRGFMLVKNKKLD
jgi:hypothetical protein